MLALWPATPASPPAPPSLTLMPRNSGALRLPHYKAEQTLCRACWEIDQPRPACTLVFGRGYPREPRWAIGAQSSSSGTRLVSLQTLQHPFLRAISLMARSLSVLVGQQILDVQCAHGRRPFSAYAIALRLTYPSPVAASSATVQRFLVVAGPLPQCSDRA